LRIRPKSEKKGSAKISYANNLYPLGTHMQSSEKNVFIRY